MRIEGIAFLVTYDCNLSCRHCFFAARRRPDLMDPVTVADALDSLPHPLPWVHFTGGEPLLDLPRFLTLVRAARARHRGEIGIVTNAFWATEPGSADETVIRLKEAGVTGVSISCDRFHQPGVPAEAVARAAAAVVRRGMVRHSWLVASLLPDHLPESGPHNRDSLREARAISAATGLPVAETVVRPLGRGGRLLPGSAPLPEGPCTELACCLGKKGPAEPAMVWVDPFGTVSICYGLAIGSLADRPLGAILDRYDPSSDPILAALTVEGPRGLYGLAAGHGVAPDGPFADPCDLCHQSRARLRPFHPERLFPGEAYP